MNTGLFWKDFTYLENRSSREKWEYFAKKKFRCLHWHIWIRICFGVAVCVVVWFFPSVFFSLLFLLVVFLKIRFQLKSLILFLRTKLNPTKYMKFLSSWIADYMTTDICPIFLFLTDAGSTEMEEGSCIWLQQQWEFSWLYKWEPWHTTGKPQNASRPQL